MLRDDFGDARFLFLSLEGAIDARAWRWGMLALFAVGAIADAVETRLLAEDPLALRTALFFGSAALLFPFAALCAKRFRDRGRSPALALWVVAPGAAHAVLTQTARLGAGDALGAALGGLTLASFGWFVLELGFAPTRRGRTAAG